MSLTEYQKASLKQHLHHQSAVVDDNGDPISPGGVTDHGALTGLADDDHPQYTTNAEATTIADAEVATHAALPNAHHARDHALNGSTHTGSLDISQLPASIQAGMIQVPVDGGGATITTGVYMDLVIPFDCTITSWDILADRSGSIQFDIWKCSYAQFDAGSTHPVVGDKITGSAKPLISSATKAQSSTLTGWTTALARGDILRLNVDSVTSIQRATLALFVTRS